MWSVFVPRARNGKRKLEARADARARDGERRLEPGRLLITGADTGFEA
jgi:hypothetical protein